MGFPLYIARRYSGLHKALGMALDWLAIHDCQEHLSLMWQQVIGQELLSYIMYFIAFRH
jgi:hypothetical protein